MNHEQATRAVCTRAARRLLIRSAIRRRVRFGAGSKQTPFYFAEDYHQQYLAKNPNGYCGLSGTGVALPKDAFAAEGVNA